MCWLHDWKYIGKTEVCYWLGGVAGGIKVPAVIDAKQCKKCGTVKEIE